MADINMAQRPIRATTLAKGRRASRRELRHKVLVYFGLLAGAFVMLIPFLWMVSTSLKSEAKVYVY
ncbi:MAG TPA: hypothetical protein VEZ12_00965, partial [Herpetosiphonaceae bacterium]|nr:hypothetical protein [Herpetosiphonaceae bacterium]